MPGRSVLAGLAASAGATGPLALAALVAAATLVSEDLTCIAAGLLVAAHRLPFALAVAACFAGIVLGDLGLVVLGRHVGRRALARAPLRWIVRPGAIEESAVWFRREGPKVVFVSRFIPGSRTPLFFAAGALHVPIRRLLGAFLGAAAIWTPLLVGLSALLGESALSLFARYERWALPALATAALLALALDRLVVPLFTWRGRRLLLSAWRRKSRWEFWPWWLFNLPVIGHWLWLGLRHRNWTLFTAANPAMPAGGFLGESKSAILAAVRNEDGAVPLFAPLPIAHEEPLLTRGEREMARLGLDFPVVVKPDVGERGAGVAIVRDREELAAALGSARRDLLLQEFVPGVEFGVFYARHPDAERGSLFSITRKEFPEVVGDGLSTLEELILADDRAVCLAPLFLDRHAERIGQVPAPGERVRLVEIGNHCRGAVFRDGRAIATPELEAAVDRIARALEGFYFGRMDLRAPSLEDFRAGRGLRVIEINGVLSEATHIYEPGASLVAAWRTLFLQWRLAFAIGDANRRRGAPTTSIAELVRLVLARDAG